MSFKQAPGTSQIHIVDFARLHSKDVRLLSGHKLLMETLQLVENGRPGGQGAEL